MFSTGKQLVSVPSNDSKVCSNLAGVLRSYFRVGVVIPWEFLSFVRKELEGKKIHQNVQKHRISGDRKQNENSEVTNFGVN